MIIYKRVGFKMGVSLDDMDLIRRYRRDDRLGN